MDNALVVAPYTEQTIPPHSEQQIHNHHKTAVLAI